jgi:hypothetical protein
MQAHWNLNKYIRSTFRKEKRLLKARESSCRAPVKSVSY